MKRVLFMLMLISSNTLMAQVTKAIPADTDGGGLGCPVGTCSVSNIYLETFNFHKPRTDCTSGFGLCIRFGVSFSCMPCYAKASVKGDMVSSWVKLSDKTAEWHLPAGLKESKGFQKTDMSTFEIEEKTLSFRSKEGLEKWVKGGIYPVRIVENELLVTMDLY